MNTPQIPLHTPDNRAPAAAAAVRSGFHIHKAPGHARREDHGQEEEAYEEEEEEAYEEEEEEAYEPDDPVEDNDTKNTPQTPLHTLAHHRAPAAAAAATGGIRIFFARGHARREDHEEEEEAYEDEDDDEAYSPPVDPDDSDYDEWEYNGPFIRAARRRERGIARSFSTAPAPYLDDTAVYRPRPPAVPASTTSSTTATAAKRERPAPPYMPLWHCEQCNDTVSVFMRDDHCRSRAHVRAVRRAGDFMASGGGVEVGVGVGGQWVELGRAGEGHVWGGGDVYQGVERGYGAGKQAGGVGGTDNARWEEESLLVDEELLAGGHGDAETPAEQAEEAEEAEDAATKGKGRQEPYVSGGGVLSARQAKKKEWDRVKSQKHREALEALEANGGEVESKWRCNVCKEPLLGEELVSHRAWHCRSGGDGEGGGEEEGKEREKEKEKGKERGKEKGKEREKVKEKEKEEREEEAVVVPTPHTQPQVSLSSSTAVPIREPQPQPQSPPATATPAPQPEVASPPPTATPPPAPAPAPAPSPPPQPPTQTPTTAPAPALLPKTFFCTPCNKYFSASNRDTHLAATKHKKRAAVWLATMRAAQGPQWEPPPSAVPSPEAPSSAAPAPTAGETFFCAPCNKSFALLGRAGHMNGQKHSKKAAAAREKENQARKETATPAPPPPPLPLPTATPVRLEKELCTVCGAHYDPAGMAAHRAGKKHLRRAAALPLRAGAQAPVSVGTRVRSEVEAEAEVVAEAEAEAKAWESRWVTVTGQRFQCSVCERERSVQDLETHVGSEVHLRNVRVAEFLAGK